MGIYIRFRSNMPIGFDWMTDLKNHTDIMAFRTIFDIGANVGQTSLPLLRVFEQADIHSFEPTRHAYEILAHRAQQHERLHSHNIAFGDQRGSLTIPVVDASLTNTLRPDHEQRTQDAHMENVSVNTVDDFCNEQSIERIDVLKCDTEGYDVPILHGAKRMLKSSLISSLIIETSFDEKNKLQSNFFEVHELLTSYGYVCAGVYSQPYLMRRSSHGSFCDSLFIVPDLLRYQP
tara:strand:- start:29 stop:727 length:699 start_codon:yes stop_codon:yes gene_type:complete